MNRDKNIPPKRPNERAIPWNGRVDTVSSKLRKIRSNECGITWNENSDKSFTIRRSSIFSNNVDFSHFPVITYGTNRSNLNISVGGQTIIFILFLCSLLYTQR